MKSIKQTWHTINKPLWGWSILFGALLPVLTHRLPFFTRVLWVEVVLLLINCLFSIWIGGYIYRHQLRWRTLFVFPVLFLLAAYFFLPHFTYYFAPAYWAISYLSWAVRQQN